MIQRGRRFSVKSAVLIYRAVLKCRAFLIGRAVLIDRNDQEHMHAAAMLPSPTSRPPRIDP